MAIRIEGLYVDLRSNNEVFTFQGQNYTFNDTFKFHFTVLRAGFTYKFDI